MLDIVEMKDGMGKFFVVRIDQLPIKTFECAMAAHAFFVGILWDNTPKEYWSAMPNID